MSKILCILHANCQGVELESLLNASRPFSSVFRIERYTNYTREIIPEESLAACGLFLYQHIGQQWGELSSSSLLAKLSRLTPSLQIPNMLFTGYWPFWASRGPLDECNDKILNKLIDEKLSEQEIVRRYLAEDILDSVDLEATVERSAAIERVKEQNAYVKTTDFILERWKKKPMFHTINHPCEELLLYTAQKILEALGLPHLTEGELTELASRQSFPSYRNFELPIHPRVAAALSLDFTVPNQDFRIYGKKMSFEQYVSCYIAFRREKREEPFLQYLQSIVNSPS